MPKNKHFNTFYQPKNVLNPLFRKRERGAGMFPSFYVLVLSRSGIISIIFKSIAKIS